MEKGKCFSLRRRKRLEKFLELRMVEGKTNQQAQQGKKTTGNARSVKQKSFFPVVMLRGKGILKPSRKEDHWFLKKSQGGGFLSLGNSKRGGLWEGLV